MKFPIFFYPWGKTSHLEQRAEYKRVLLLHWFSKWIKKYKAVLIFEANISGVYQGRFGQVTVYFSRNNSQGDIYLA